MPHKNHEKRTEYQKHYRFLHKEELSEKKKLYSERTKDHKQSKGKERYKNKREEILKRVSKYYEENREKISEKGREYYQVYKENLRKKARSYHLANREKIAQRAKVRRAQNRKMEAERMRLYRKSHPDIIHANHARRRAAKAAVIDTLTTNQWIEIKAIYKHRCVYCGKKSQRLTMDHITPLKKGGGHTASNIVPACRPCNSRKRDRVAPFLIQPVLLTIAPGK